MAAVNVLGSIIRYINTQNSVSLRVNITSVDELIRNGYTESRPCSDISICKHLKLKRWPRVDPDRIPCCLAYRPE